MQATKPFIFRFGAGVVALAAVALVVLAVGMNSSDSPAANAADPTPTKVSVNDGNLAGVNDILVGDLTASPPTALFWCISKTDHDATTNAIHTSTNCNVDLAGFGETGLSPTAWSDMDPSMAAVGNANEPGGDGIAGPPSPPPYTTVLPQQGFGEFYPAGGDPDGLCGTDPCTVTYSCFQDVGRPADSGQAGVFGGGGTGPNIISRVVIINPKSTSTVNGMDQVTGGPDDDAFPSDGTTDIWYNQNNADCDKLMPKGSPALPNLPLWSIAVADKGEANPNPNPALWRAANAATTTNWDGDLCTDEEELDLNDGTKCGFDPLNPFDSFDPNTVDLSGNWTLVTRVARADCGNPCDIDNGTAGIYFYCRTDVQHVSNAQVEFNPFCYIDSAASEINTEAFPGVVGDGYAGGPPPGPCNATPNENDCDPDFPNHAYADTSATTQTQLVGTWDKGTNTLSVDGCFADDDGNGALGDVWVEVTLDPHELPGAVNIYAGSGDGDHTDGTFCENTNSGGVLPGELIAVKQPKGKTRDADQDGVSDAREVTQLGAPCGSRDPYNKNDYFDVSIPRDGVVDLLGDILGVVNNFNPVGYTAGDPGTVGVLENFDRPAPMTGGAGGWSRGQPDGKIDLLIDVLGVIGQFNPTTDCRTAP